ncbi:MAG: hypothetical protein IJO08_01455 [Clostridia bacterium]|nr:hypothetical protein [Clostridia bacterium]
MKVLFAVGNDQLSKNIADKYYEKYGEVLEYKNVFYFKALIEEVKRDKTYNRIVINEEIEEYRATDLEQIDRKIFNYIDQITDEIPDADVIIICGNRRNKSDSFIKKLFSSGIYNFLIGGDRNVGPLCEILRKPKNKREAKEYLGIDSPFSEDPMGSDGGDVVDEYQIRSILNFYEGIKNQPEKYVETFDRIAEQYSRVQLMIIYTWLPPAVKAAISQVDRYKYLSNPPSAISKKEEPKQVITKPQSPKDNPRRGLFGGLRKNKPNPPSSKDTMDALDKGKVDLGENASNSAEDLAKAEEERKLKEQAAEEARKQAELAAKARADAEARQQAEIAARAKAEEEAKQQAALEAKARAEVEARKQAELAEQARQEALRREQEAKQAEQQKQQDEQAKLLEQAKKEAAMREQQANQQKQQDDQAKLMEQAKKEAAMREQQANQQKQQDEQAKLMEQAKKEAAMREQQANQQKQQDEQAKLMEQAKKEAAMREQQANQQKQQDEQAKLMEQAKKEAAMREQQNSQVKPEEQTKKEINVEVDKVVQPAKDFNVNIKPNPNAPISKEIEIDVAPIKKEPIKVEPNLQEPKAPVVSQEPPKETIVEAKPIQPEPPKVPVTQITPPRPMNEPKPAQPVEPTMSQPSRPASLNVSIPNVPTPEQVASGRILQNSNRPQSPEELKLKEEQEKLAMEQQKIKMEQERLEEEKRKIREEQERLLNAQNQLKTTDNAVPNMSPYTNTTVVSAPQMPNGAFKKMVVFVGANKAGTTFVANAVAHAMASARIMTSILDMTRDKGMWYIYSQQYSAAQQKKMSDYMQRISDGEEVFIETANNYLKVYSAPGSITDVRRGFKHKNIIDVVRNNTNVVIVDADFTTPIDYFEQASEIYIVQDLDILKMPDTTLFLRELKNRGMNMKKIKVVFNKYVKTSMLNPKKLLQVMSTYSDPAMTYMESDLLPTKVDFSMIPYNINNYTKYTEALCAGLTNYKGYSSDFLEVINEIVRKIYQDSSSTRMPQMNQPKGMKKFFG